MATNVKARVSRDLESHCCAVDTDAFLKQHFPIPTTHIEDVYSKLKYERYDPKKGWLYNGKKMCKKSTKSQKDPESLFSDLLISICEAIITAATEAERTNVGCSCTWFKSTRKTPSSSDVKVSLIRPDI